MKDALMHLQNALVRLFESQRPTCDDFGIEAELVAAHHAILALLAEGPVNPKGEPEQSPSKTPPPQAPGDPAPTTGGEGMKCSDCHGDGYTWEESAEDAWKADCTRCGGTGIIPGEDPPPAPPYRQVVKVQMKREERDGKVLYFNPDFIEINTERRCGARRNGRECWTRMTKTAWECPVCSAERFPRNGLEAVERSKGMSLTEIIEDRHFDPFFKLCRILDRLGLPPPKA